MNRADRIPAGTSGKARAQYAYSVWAHTRFAKGATGIWGLRAEAELRAWSAQTQLE